MALNVAKFATGREIKTVDQEPVDQELKACNFLTANLNLLMIKSNFLSDKVIQMIPKYQIQFNI